MPKRIGLFADDADGATLLQALGRELDLAVDKRKQRVVTANTNAGTRPSFTPAAPPDVARQLFDYFVRQAQRKHSTVETGRFGADMKVSLNNDGPVTFWLETKKSA